MATPLPALAQQQGSTCGDLNRTLFPWYLGRNDNHIYICDGSNLQTLMTTGASGLTVGFAGSVGIGTTSPSYALDVNSTATVGSIMSRGKINETSTDQGVQIGYGPAGDSPRFWLGDGTVSHNWQIDNFSGVMRFFRQLTL